MKTQDIKNMGQALKQVQEKILTQKDKQKALAKAARTAKPKDQVSLKPMPASLANKMAKDEAFKKGDAVTPSKGPHKGQQHTVIHDYGDGHYNIKPHGVTGSQNKYRMGAAKAHKNDLKKMKSEAMSDDEKDFKPHMMYDPKTGKGHKADKFADHLRMKKMGYTHDDPSTKKKEEGVQEYSMVRAMKNHMKKMKKDEALKGDQHKLDHDKDGDIDAADFKKLRAKKKGEKSEVKPRQEPDTEKGKGDAPMEKKESTRWPVYARIMEKQDRGEHYKSATGPEAMDSKENPGGKKMRKDMKADNPEVNDTEAKSHQDAADAGRKGPGAKARPNDNMKGDKAIVNPVKGAVTSGSN